MKPEHLITVRVPVSLGISPRRFALVVRLPEAYSLTLAGISVRNGILKVRHYINLMRLEGDRVFPMKGKPTKAICLCAMALRGLLLLNLRRTLLAHELRFASTTAQAH